MKYLLLYITIFITLLSTGARFLHASESIENKQQSPIKVIINDWSSQIVLSKILGNIFRKMGYKVEYTQVSVDNQWGALSRGLEHVQVEVWEGTMSMMFNRMLRTGGIIDVGSYTAITREDWWYPSYVEEQCPGLPDWRALRDCASIFAIPETMPAGRYLAGPWEKPDPARIRALKLNFVAVPVRHANELWTELKKSFIKKQPIILFNWTPNWTETVYEGNFIEFPEYDSDCETKPEWGVNPDFTHDCGNKRKGWLKKAAWSGMEKKWPCAFQVLRNMDLTNSDFAKIAALVNVDNKSFDMAATHWVTENTKLWMSWIPKGCLK